MHACIYQLIGNRMCDTLDRAIMHLEMHATCGNNKMRMEARLRKRVIKPAKKKKVTGVLVAYISNGLI